MKTKNAKRRFYDIIKTMRDIKFIKIEKKEIALYTKNTKIAEQEKLKNEILDK
jgi:hypothetical protein